VAAPHQGSDQALEKRHRVAGAANEPSSRPIAVIPLMIDILPSGGTMILMSLVRWTTGFVINWFFAADQAGGEIDQRLQGWLDWSAVDDTGGTYDGADVGGGGGSSLHWTFTTWFAPELAPTATKLTVRVTNPADGCLIDTELPLRPS